MFASMSIRAKIMSVVALLLVALTAMGLLAVSSMRTMNANTVDITTNWLPSVRVLGDLRAATISYRTVVREHLLAETLDDKLAQEKTAATTNDVVNKTIKLYEPMITSREERAIYQDWKTVWDRYLAGTEKVMELSRKAAGQIPHDAHELNKNTVNKIGLQADEVLRKDIDLNNSGADKASADAASTYSTSFATLGAIVGAMLMLGAIVSYLMVRSVSRGITSIVEPMQALGEGDLSAEIPHRGEKTEMGAMANALQIFKDALIAKKAADEAAAKDAEAKIERGRRGRRRHTSVRGRDRRHRQHRVLGVEPAGSLGRHSDVDGRPLATAGHDRRLSFGGSLDQRAVGRLCHGGAVIVGDRDQPPGAGVGAHGERGGHAGPHHQ